MGPQVAVDFGFTVQQERVFVEFDGDLAVFHQEALHTGIHFSITARANEGFGGGDVGDGEDTVVKVERWCGLQWNRMDTTNTATRITNGRELG